MSMTDPTGAAPRAEPATTMRAPWTAEQVAALNAHQDRNDRHPFTCVNRGDGLHKMRGRGDYGILVATEQGWTCPDCDYTQDWAHDFMFASEQSGSADVQDRAGLLPCPFCGNPAVVTPDNSYGECIVGCNSCEMEVAVSRDKADLTGAIAVWNRRAPAARSSGVPSDQERAELARQLMEMVAPNQGLFSGDEIDLFQRIAAALRTVPAARPHCDECGAWIDSGIDVCTHCGRQTQPEYSIGRIVAWLECCSGPITEQGARLHFEGCARTVPTAPREPDALPTGVPHRCPVCDGARVLGHPPGVPADQGSSSTSTGPWPCSACNGSGIVWGAAPAEPASDPFFGMRRTFVPRCDVCKEKHEPHCIGCTCFGAVPGCCCVADPSSREAHTLVRDMLGVAVCTRCGEYEGTSVVCSGSAPPEPVASEPPDMWSLIRAQTCNECGAPCRCKRDGVLQLSSACCVHGEAACCEPVAEPATEPAARCGDPHPQYAYISCDEPKGHAGKHSWHTGGEMTWNAAEPAAPRDRHDGDVLFEYERRKLAYTEAIYGRENWLRVRIVEVTSEQVDEAEAALDEWVEKISRDLTGAIEQQRRVVAYLDVLITDAQEFVYTRIVLQAAQQHRDDAAAVLRKLEGK